jgi:hypothetical protein
MGPFPPQYHLSAVALWARVDAPLFSTHADPPRCPTLKSRRRARSIHGISAGHHPIGGCRDAGARHAAIARREAAGPHRPGRVGWCAPARTSGGGPQTQPTAVAAIRGEDADRRVDQPGNPGRGGSRQPAGRAAAGRSWDHTRSHGRAAPLLKRRAAGAAAPANAASHPANPARPAHGTVMAIGLWTEHVRSPVAEPSHIDLR